MPSSDHREKAVDAAAQSLFDYTRSIGLGSGTWRQPATQALDAADPHLRRAHFEEFRAAMLCEASVAAGKKRLPLQGEVREKVPRVLEVALAKAQELLEEENGG